MKIKLLYFDGCPAYAELRERVAHLLDRAGVLAVIEERRVDSEPEAVRERFLGSPTLRVDGRDVDPAPAYRAGYGLQCRLYAADGGIRRTRPDAWITTAIRGAR